MAKRRHKNKARRSFVELRRKVNITDGNVDQLENIDGSSETTTGQDFTAGDLKLKVQFTDNTNLDSKLTDCDMKPLKSNEPSSALEIKVKGKKCKGPVSARKQSLDNDENKDEVWIYPMDIDGERCIEIQCGANDAFMYLNRLCVGSQGACIKFSGSWLTPNEFQLVSGRETAKDWKRSIRHKGRSLKLLINKGLITVQTVLPKKSSPKSPKPSADNPDKANTPTKRDEDVSKPTGDGNVSGSPPRKQINSVVDTTTSVQPETQSHAVVKRKGRKPKAIRGRRLTNRNGGKNHAYETNGTNKPCQEPDVSGVLSDGASKLEPRSDLKDVSKDQTDEVSPAPADTRTDEERRLDEFVKSLRLTKTNGQCTNVVKPMTALTADVAPTTVVPSLKNVANETEPEIINSEPGDDGHDSAVVELDPEMPVLQKEADVINDYDAAALALSVSVDAVNATVTPPPTPPCDRLEMEPKSQSVCGLKHVETFKSTLASPSNGLKLTINREKQNYQTQFTNSDAKIDITPLAKPETQCVDIQPETATKALLLQDALKSARKYKEQLQQSQLTSPIKSPSLAPKATVEPVLPNTSIASTHHGQPVKENARNFINGYHNSVTKMKTHPTAPPCDVTHRRHAGYTMPTGNVATVADISQLSTSSFQEFLSTMGSVYGPMPSSLDQKDTAAPLQDLQLKYDMLRMLQSQGRHDVTVDGMTSPHATSLLYPMITQQLLLAMTQQLKNMCNIPDMPVSPGNGLSPGGNISHRNPTSVSRTPDVSVSKQNSNISSLSYLNEKHKKKATPVDKHIPHAHNNTNTRSSAHSMQDNFTKKRKHVEMDNNGAIDLSMKKPRTSGNSYSPTSVLNGDAPLDFSLKRTVSSHMLMSSAPKFPPYSSPTIYNGSTNGASRHPAIYGDVTSHQTTVTSTPTYRNYVNSVTPLSCQCTCGSGQSEMESWNVEHVCSFLKTLDGCSSYTKTFREQGISGRLLPYLTSQHLTRTLGMTTSSATALLNAVERRLRDQKSLTCALCRNQRARVSQPSHS